MISIDPALLILAVEAGAALVVVLLAMMIAIFVQRRRVNAALRHFVDQIKASNDERKATTENFLKERCQLDEDSVTKFTTDLLQAETALYRQVVEAAFTRKKEILAEIANKTSQLLSHYRSLNAEKTPAVVETTVVTVVDEQRINELSQETERLTKKVADYSIEIATLKEDNKKLSEDLSKNEMEMDRLIAEYSKAFRDKKNQELSPELTVIGSEISLSAMAAQPSVDDWVPTMSSETTLTNNATLGEDTRLGANPIVEHNIENLDALDELLDLTTHHDKIT